MLPKPSGSREHANSRKALNHPLFFSLALLRVSGLGPISIQRLLLHFGNAESVFSASDESLAALGLPRESSKEIRDIQRALLENSPNSVLEGVQNDLGWVRHHRHYILSSDEKSYPESLRQIYDAPPLLFVIGELSLLNRPQLAVVGSRRPSKTGALDAGQMAEQLVQAGLVVTSGLATGIDTHAHNGALRKSGHSTIAVLAHGLDNLYPKRNRYLAAEILAKGGALVSEFPTGVQPRPEYFPRRNRIISGLSKGTLVVEAAKKSGSLHTAYSALEQGREVFAIPGSIHNPVARGCHQLIKQGAKLVENTDDILEELPFYDEDKLKTGTAVSQRDGERLNAEQETLWAQLSHEEMSENDLLRATGLDVSTLSGALLALELKGLIIRGEKGFARNPHA